MSSVPRDHANPHCNILNLVYVLLKWEQTLSSVFGGTPGGLQDLSSRSETKPTSPGVEVQILNHWPARSPQNLRSLPNWKEKIVSHSGFILHFSAINGWACVFFITQQIPGLNLFPIVGILRDSIWEFQPLVIQYVLSQLTNHPCYYWLNTFLVSELHPSSHIQTSWTWTDLVSTYTLP